MEEMNAVQGAMVEGREPSQLVRFQETQRTKGQELLRPARLQQREASTTRLAPPHCRMLLRSPPESTVLRDTQSTDRSAPASLLVAE